MDNEDIPMLIIAIAGATYLLGLITGVIVFSSEHYSYKEIIAHECAHYDSYTGEFTWNTK